MSKGCGKTTVPKTRIRPNGFLGVHAAVHNIFNLQRHLIPRSTLRIFRSWLAGEEAQKPVEYLLRRFSDRFPRHCHLIDPTRRRMIFCSLLPSMKVPTDPTIEMRKIETAPGLVFDCSVAGGASAPLVLMLHGFCILHYHWDNQVPVEAAAGYFRANDRPIHGSSPG